MAICRVRCGPSRSFTDPLRNGDPDLSKMWSHSTPILQNFFHAELQDLSAALWRQWWPSMAQPFLPWRDPAAPAVPAIFMMGWLFGWNLLTCREAAWRQSNFWLRRKTRIDQNGPELTSIPHWNSHIGLQNLAEFSLFLSLSGTAHRPRSRFGLVLAPDLPDAFAGLTTYRLWQIGRNGLFQGQTDFVDLLHCHFGKSHQIGPWKYRNYRNHGDVNVL